MRFEVDFDGTPAQFGVMAEQFGYRLFDSERDNADVITQRSTDTGPAANPVHVIFYQRKSKRAGKRSKIGYATAQMVGQGKTRLFVQADDAGWPELAPVWDRLLAEMQRQGWVTARDATGDVTIPTRPKDLQRWKDAWKLIRECENRARVEFNNDRCDSARVTTGDLVHYIFTKMQWSPSEKTISKIRKAGQSGKLV